MRIKRVLCWTIKSADFCTKRQIFVGRQNRPADSIDHVSSVYRPLLSAVVFLQPLVDTELVEGRLDFGHARILLLDLTMSASRSYNLNQTFVQTRRQTAVRTQPAQRIY